jgi:hypothetical protein
MLKIINSILNKISSQKLILIPVWLIAIAQLLKEQTVAHYN